MVFGLQPGLHFHEKKCSLGSLKTAQGPPMSALCPLHFHSLLICQTFIRLLLYTSLSVRSVKEPVYNLGQGQRWGRRQVHGCPPGIRSQWSPTEGIPVLPGAPGRATWRRRRGGLEAVSLREGVQLLLFEGSW